MQTTIARAAGRLGGMPRSSFVVPGVAALGAAIFFAWKPGVTVSAIASPRAFLFTAVIGVLTIARGWLLPRLERGFPLTAAAQSVPVNSPSRSRAAHGHSERPVSRGGRLGTRRCGGARAGHGEPRRIGRHSSPRVRRSSVGPASRRVRHPRRYAGHGAGPGLFRARRPGPTGATPTAERE